LSVSAVKNVKIMFEFDEKINLKNISIFAAMRSFIIHATNCYFLSYEIVKSS